MFLRNVVDGNDVVRVTVMDSEEVLIMSNEGTIKKEIVTEEAWYYGTNSYHYENGGNEEEFKTSQEFNELSCLNRLGKIYVQNDVEYIDMTEEIRAKFIESIKTGGLNTMYQDSWYSIDEDEAPYCDMSYDELKQYEVFAEPAYCYDNNMYFIDISKYIAMVDDVKFLKVKGKLYVSKDDYYSRIDIDSVDAIYELDRLEEYNDRY